MGAVTLTPAEFIVASVKQTVQGWNKEFIVTDSMTIQAVKVIRKGVKAAAIDDEKAPKKDGQETYRTIYSTLTKPVGYKTRYLNIPKNEVYQLEGDHSVVLAVTPEKAEQFNTYEAFYLKNQDQFVAARNSRKNQKILDALINNEYGKLPEDRGRFTKSAANRAPSC